jgi:hypothetical protein
MPNIVRRTRQCRPLRPSERTRDHAHKPGTRLTHKQCYHIFTLSDLLHWSSEAIAVAMGLPWTTVQSVLRLRVESPKKQTGRKHIITCKVQERLVARATLDAAHRRMMYKEIARLEGVHAGQKALIVAFKMESYGRRVATLKPLLTEAQKKVCLAWAIEHLSWKPEYWVQVVWTDKCSFSTEGFGKVYVTRQLDEKYDESYYTPKFKTYSSWTIHRSISVFGKGDIVVIKMKWGRVMSKVLE